MRQDIPSGHPDLARPASVAQLYTFAKRPDSHLDLGQPSNFLWGARELEQAGVEVFHAYPATRTEFRRLGSLLGYLRYIRAERQRLNHCDAVFTVSHNALQAAAIARRLGWLKSRVVGVLGAIDMGQRRGRVPWAHLRADRFTFTHCHKVVYFTSAEAATARENLRLNAEKIDWMPLGVDRTFYSPVPGQETQRGDYILAIGNDHNRDWRVLGEVAADMPGQPFLLLTQNRAVSEQSFPPNVRVRTDATFAESRDLLARAAAHFLPTKPNHHFSGLTTVLNALTLGTPQVLDEETGLADYGLVDGENCLTFRRGNKSGAVRALRQLLLNPYLGRRISSRSLELGQRYSMKHYAANLAVHLGLRAFGNPGGERLAHAPAAPHHT